LRLGFVSSNGSETNGSIDAEYNVRVGYWASKNNVYEYKVYSTVIWMFDPNFMNNLRQVLGDNLWPTEPTNQNYRTCLLHQAEYLLGTSKVDQYSLVEAAHKKWIENENDLNYDEYELPI